MAPLPKIAVGGAPPPRLPGGVFPKKKIICISVKTNQIIQFLSKFGQNKKIALHGLLLMLFKIKKNPESSFFGQNCNESKWLD